MARGERQEMRVWRFVRSRDRRLFAKKERAEKAGAEILYPDMLFGLARKEHVLAMSGPEAVARALFALAERSGLGKVLFWRVSDDDAREFEALGVEEVNYPTAKAGGLRLARLRGLAR